MNKENNNSKPPKEREGHSDIFSIVSEVSE